MYNKKIPGTLAVIVALLLIASCHSYYKAGTLANNSTGRSIDSLNKTSRFMILRNGEEAYAMTNVTLSADQQFANCVLDRLPSNHTLHLTKGVNGTMRYDRKNLNHAEVINEVHFYIRHDDKATVGNYTLPLDKVFKIEVLSHDKKRTTNSYVLGTIGTVLGSIVVVAIIIAATKSSCPFVSAYDGNDFTLQGEIYGGAIYPQLARKDYLPLRMGPTKNGDLQLKITNELKEKQYTDYVRLWRIEHSPASNIYVDQEGKLHCTGLPQQPVSAEIDGKKDVLKGLLKENDFQQVYMDDSSKADAINDLDLRFNKPKNATKARLILSMKNSYWLDLLYGELAKGFGNYYATYLKEQKQKPAAELQRWAREQSLPLTIQMNCGDGWQTVKYITTTGPVAFRKTAVSVNLPANSADHLEFRLSSGFMFWEFDYAAIDYEEDLPFQILKMEPIKATDENGSNVLPVLLKEDNIHLEQPIIGSAATITFKPDEKENPSMRYDYVLESKGYYEHIRDFTNLPDRAFLAQFKVAGGFPKFGKQLYGKMKDQALSQLASVK